MTPHVTRYARPAGFIRRMPFVTYSERSSGPFRYTPPARRSLLTAPRATSAARGRLASAQNIGRGEVVPATTLTDLNDIDPEFAVFSGHLVELGTALHPSRVLPEFIPIHIGNMRYRIFAANGANYLGRLPVKLRRAQQVGMRVTDVRDRRAPGPYRRERCTPGEPVIHHRTTRGHVFRVLSPRLLDGEARPML